jgi:hypothetical protein
MAEKFAERSAGIWLPLVFYAAGGAYMLAFWGVFDRLSYHLVLLGILSIIIAVALYLMTRWAFWLGLFTFPVFFVLFLFALLASVNFVGWDPNIATAAFHASIIVYLVFLVFSLVLLIDKRNTLKSVSIPYLKFPAPAPKKEDADKTRKKSKEEKD